MNIRRGGLIRFIFAVFIIIIMTSLVGYYGNRSSNAIVDNKVISINISQNYNTALYNNGGVVVSWEENLKGYYTPLDVVMFLLSIIVSKRNTVTINKLWRNKGQKIALTKI